jgi:hypothetical protein
MVVTFEKVLGAPAVHRWPDGTVATCLPWTGGLPHDLGHWLLEAQVDLPYGFWSLAGQQAPFASLTLVQGRWPKGRQAWFDRVRRRHATAMLHAEAQDGAWLADPDLDVHARWPELRDLLARTYAFADSPLASFGPADVERLRPFALRAAATWDALPAGAAVEVHWPGANDLVVVAAGDVVPAPSRPGVVPVIAPGRDREGRPLHRRVELDRRTTRSRRRKAAR